MLFFVDITLQLSERLRDPRNQRRDELLEAEFRGGRELHAAGVIQRIWRIPGEQRNVGIWEAEDPTVLHEAIASLPLWPWLRVTVTPLAEHPVESAARREAAQ